MTLATTPEYDSEQISTEEGRAVVVGGSMAGLLAARVLSDAFEEVILIEKDPIPDEPEPRRGVPQAQHIHAMQEAGRATLKDLFPGYSDELVSAGAEVIDISTDFNFYDEGDFVADGSTRLPMYCASRPLFEYITQQRVRNLDSVNVRDECQFLGYLTDDGGSSVEGVTVADQGSEEEEGIAAELVVDATGRTSRTPRWLENHGYPSPEVDEVKVDLAYSTVYLDRPPEDNRAFFVMPCPPRNRGIGVLPVEGDRWVMTAFGVHGDHPPTDVEELSDFVDSLPIDELSRLIEEREVVSEGVAHYPFPANLRRRYWELDRFPESFVVIGDSIASFNPIYGQGMSVSSLEALHLHHALAEGGYEDIGLRFFSRIERVVEDAWSLAVGTDFRFSETTGPKPTGTDILNLYLSRLTRKAHEDGELAEAYTRVVTMEKRPTSLLRPGVAWRVLKPSVSV